MLGNLSSIQSASARIVERNLRFLSISDPFSMVHFDSWSAWTQTSKLLHSRMSSFPLRSWRSNSWIRRFVSGVIMRCIRSCQFLMITEELCLVIVTMEYIYICNFHVCLKTLILFRHLKGSCPQFLLRLCQQLWVLQRIDIDYYGAIMMLGQLVDISYLLLWLLDHMLKLYFLQIFKNHLFGKHREYSRFDFEHDAFDVLLVQQEQFLLMDRRNMAQDFFFARDQNGVDELMDFCF